MDTRSISFVRIGECMGSFENGARSVKFREIDRRTCHPSVVLAIAFAICPSMTFRQAFETRSADMRWHVNSKRLDINLHVDQNGINMLSYIKVAY
jgi:hypothetical protein